MRFQTAAPCPCPGCLPNGLLSVSEKSCENNDAALQLTCSDGLSVAVCKSVVARSSKLSEYMYGSQAESGVNNIAGGRLPLPQLWVPYEYEWLLSWIAGSGKCTGMLQAFMVLAVRYQKQFGQCHQIHGHLQ